MKSLYILIFCVLLVSHSFAQNISTYQYDKFNRLTNSANENASFQYVFDELGNRVQYGVTAQGVLQADLQVENITIPSGVFALGVDIAVSCNVSNAGGANAAGSYLKVYLCSSTTGAETELASQFVSEVSAGGEVSVSLNLTIPQNAEVGNKYLVFFTDATAIVSESEETNNKSNKLISIVANTQLDLQLQNAQVSPTELLAGESAIFSVDILNQGSVDVGEFQLKCYLSLNPTFESYSDIEITEVSLDYTSLGANSTVSYNKNVSIPSNTVTGMYYLLYVADVDNNVSEQNEENNVASCSLTVSSANGSSGSAPTASFTADVQNIGEGTTVQFTESSSNNPTSWQWSFPGGTPNFSTAQKPSITYVNKGVFDVSLTASSGSGMNTLSKSKYISVGQPAQYGWLWHQNAVEITDIAVVTSGEIIGVGGSAYGSYSSEGELIWTKTITGTKMRAVAVDKDDNFIITGTIRSDNPIDFGNGHVVSIGNVDGEDGFLAKFDSNGSVLWVHRIYDTDVSNNTSSRTMYLMDVCLDDAGNPYIVGYYNGFYGDSDYLYLRFPNGKYLRNENQSYNLILAKFSSEGVTQWVTEIEEYNGGAGDVQGYSVDTDGTNVGVVGNFSGSIIVDNDTRSVRTASGVEDIFVIECNANTGDYESFEQYGGSGSSNSFNYRDCAYGIKYISNGQKYVTGKFLGDATFGSHSLSTNGVMNDAFLIKSYNNQVYWAKPIDSPTNACFGTHLAVNTNKDVFWLGKYGINSVIDGITMDESGTYIAKYNKNGDYEFINSVSDETYDYPWEASLIVDTEDNLYFADGSKISKYGIIKPVIHPKLKCDNSIVCSGSNTIINAPEGYSSYQWSNGEITSSISVSESGEYHVEVTDYLGYSGLSDTIKIESIVSPTSVISTTDQLSFCEGSGATLVANAGTDYTYKWKKDGSYMVGGIEDSFTGTESGEYQVEISNNGLCPVLSEKIALTKITASAEISILTSDDDICEGEEITFTTRTSNEGDSPVYQWQINYNNVGTNSNTFTMSQLSNSDIVTCKLTSSEECVSENTVSSNEIKMTVNILPKVDIGQDISICKGDSIFLDAGEYETYSWSNGSKEKSIYVKKTDVYYVDVTDVNACSARSNNRRIETLELPDVVLPEYSEMCEGEAIYLQGGEFETYLWDDGSTEPILKVVEAGEYSVTVTNQYACSQKSNLSKVVLNPLPIINIGEDKTLCIGDVLTLDAGSYTQYEWSDGSSNSKLDVSESGKYSVRVTNDKNCNNSSNEISVDFIELPNLDLGIDTTICSADKFVLSPGIFNTYEWQDGSLMSEFAINIAGEYHVKVSDQYGCIASDTINIKIKESPYVIFSDSGEICEGGAIQLNAGEHESYLWNDGSIEKTLWIEKSGEYNVTVKSENGCKHQSNNFILTTNPAPVVDLGNDVSICKGESITFDAGEYAKYKWSNGSENRSVEVFQSGSFGVDVTDNKGCLGVSNTVKVDVHELPIVDYSYQADGLDIAFTNKSENADTYFWEFGDGITTTAENPVHTYLTPNEYSVILTGVSNNCEGIRSKDIIIEKITTGIEDVSKQIILEVYPNPCDNLINVKIDNFNTDVTIDIYSLKGVLVKSLSFKNYALNKVISVSELSTGIYLIQVKIGSLVFTEKILKN